jgi:hypothetical protein
MLQSSCDSSDPSLMAPGITFYRSFLNTCRPTPGETNPHIPLLARLTYTPTSDVSSNVTIQAACDRGCESVGQGPLIDSNRRNILAHQEDRGISRDPGRRDLDVMHPFDFHLILRVVFLECSTLPRMPDSTLDQQRNAGAHSKFDRESSFQKVFVATEIKRNEDS